jgi:hypothetical protein
MKSSGLGIDQIRPLTQMEEKNARLKRMLADPAPDHGAVRS